MNRKHILPRLATRAIEARLAVMPVVVVTGARQSGKSTLARQLLRTPRPYFTLDDLDLADRARREPDSLVNGTDPITVDEIQRAPELLHAVKRAVDEDRRPGRFLLTGSANLLLMKGVSESLAGRAAYVSLRPLTRGEREGRESPSLWASLLAEDPTRWEFLLTDAGHAPADWQSLVKTGGFPTPAAHLYDPDARGIWFEGYVRTYLERDLLDVSAVASLPDFRRLMRAAAHRTGQMVNQAELGRTISMPQPTVHRFLNLLETGYMVLRLPAYSVNRTKRLVRTPKLYWGDTALALHLAGHDRPDGCHLENLVLLDLTVARETGGGIDEVFYWRTTSGAEVDFVLERGDRLLPIEVTATREPSARDARGVESFLDEYPGSARGGLVLHTGDTVRWLTPRVLAAPWWRVF